MNIDTEHLHHWMQAIRQSPDPMRTMDAFWSGQLRSKEWLIDCLDEHVHHRCESIANMMNRQEYLNNKFRAVTANMCEIRSDADISINTSFEHISQDDYDLWLSGLKHNSLIVLQTNNYKIPEHIRISKNLEEFKEQAGLEKVLYSGELELPLYKRFMIIGYKNV